MRLSLGTPVLPAMPRSNGVLHVLHAVRRLVLGIRSYRSVFGWLALLRVSQHLRKQVRSSSESLRWCHAKVSAQETCRGQIIACAAWVAR